MDWKSVFDSDCHKKRKIGLAMDVDWRKKVTNIKIVTEKLYDPDA